MTFTKSFGALALVLTVAFNAGAGEPAVVAPDQTSAQAIDQWYANNQSDAAAAPDAPAGQAPAAGAQRGRIVAGEKTEPPRPWPRGEPPFDQQPPAAQDDLRAPPFPADGPPPGP